MSAAETGIRFLLYAHPLYASVPKNARRPWEIVIAGLTDHAVSFLKQAMQLAAVCPEGAVFRIICRESERSRAEAFLQSAPALGRFFTVQGALPDLVRRSYGQIDMQFGSDPAALTAAALHQQAADYLFISAGTDTETMEIVRVCEQLRTEAEVVAELNVQPASAPQLSRFTVFQPECAPEGAQAALMQQLERMSRNLHWIWSKKSTYRKTDESYWEEGNRNSSLASAASIQYKLHCTCGIDLLRTGAAEAAALFSACTSGSNPDAAKICDEIGNAEHRRWCTERLFEGFVPWEDYDAAAEAGRTKLRSDAGRFHLCLRDRMSDDELLAQKKPILRMYRPEIWHTLRPEDFPDPLDQMSLRYHAACLRKLRRAREKDDAMEHLYRELEFRLTGSREAMTAFRNWKLCVRRILRSQDRYARKLCPEAYSRLCSYLPETDTAEIMQNLEAVECAFEFQDYRQIDTDFAENIPHVLTYDDSLTVAVPVSAKCGMHADAVFSQIAAIYALEPKAGMLLFWLQNEQELHAAEDLLERLDLFLIQLTFRTGITAYLFCPSPLLSAVKVKPAKITLCTVPGCRDLQDAAAAACRLFADLEQNGQLYAVQYRQQSALSGALFTANMQIPHFQFDSASQRFSALHRGTELLPAAAVFDYIRRGAVRPLLIRDLMRLSRAELLEDEQTQPEYTAYSETLYHWFQDHADDFKSCGQFLAANRSRRVKFESPEPGTQPEMSFRITLDAELSFPELEAALLTMQDCGLIRQYRAERVPVQKTAFSMEIYPQHEAAFLKLFGDAEKYDGGKAKYAFYDVGKKKQKPFYRFELDSMQFGDLDPAEKGKIDWAHLPQFLAKMAEFELITPPEQVNGEIKFCYQSRQCKEILTSSGRLLEIFLYCQMIQKLDQVKTGAVILWDRGKDLKNETDIIAVSGYRTYLIEAKAKNQINSEAIAKCACIGKNFGVNPQIVLFGMTDGTDRRLEALGELFGVSVLTEHSLGELSEQLLRLIGGS